MYIYDWVTLLCSRNWKSTITEKKSFLKKEEAETEKAVTRALLMD